MLIGAKGQLGETFSKHFMDSSLSQRYELIRIDIKELNFLYKDVIPKKLSGLAPSVIVNCAAYTDVDKAEQQVELAKNINDDAVSIIAKWASQNQCRLVHISTDYVFDGSKNQPYAPSDNPNPLCIYGKTKLAGEMHVLGMQKKGGAVIRTSWLYSEFGSNFVKSMLRLMSKKQELSIVSDQVGSPTSTHSLVKVIFGVLSNNLSSRIYHWTDGASISWYDFACEIQRQAYDQRMLNKKIPIKPIKSSAYQSVAARPAYSVLDRRDALDQLKLKPSSWEIELGRVLIEIGSS